MPEYTAFPIPRRIVDVNALQQASVDAVAAAATAAPVAGIVTQINTVAGIAADVTTVAGVAESVPIVAGLAPDFAAAVAAASTATTQAGIATTEASNAATSAGAAATSASTATTQAGIATTEAGTATTQAGIATAQASNASASAAEAAADAAAASSSLRAVGEPFALWDHITGCPVPSNAGTAKFIKLTAGLMGVGAYNEGLLGSESVTGTAPLVTATATILVGPMAGQTVHLINTEEAFLRARATSGDLQMDQMQRITGSITSTTAQGVTLSTSTGAGAITLSGDGSGASAAGANRPTQISFNTANSPDSRVSSTTSGETRSKNVSATFYLRIA